MPENADPTKQENETEEQSSAVDDAKLNAVVQSHIKRAMKGVTAELSKTFGEQIAKAVEGLKPVAATADDDKSKKGGKADDKDDPRLKLALEEIEKLKRSNQEAADRAKALEDKSRKDGARTALREALDAKGIKGARAAALISHMESTGMLRFTEDGEPVLGVSRSRSKGARAEELEFDISSGVEDWIKTSEAAEFLPAPSSSTTANNQTRGSGAAARAQQQQQQVRRTARYEEPAVTDEEAARRTFEQLSNQGINVDALLND